MNNTPQDKSFTEHIKELAVQNDLIPGLSIVIAVVGTPVAVIAGLAIVRLIGG